MAKRLRQAQRAHLPVHCALADGISADGTPHSVAGRTVWLLTAGPHPVDLFLRLSTITDVADPA